MSQISLRKFGISGEVWRRWLEHVRWGAGEGGNELIASGVFA